MAHLQYYNYEKAGRINSETYGYSQVVRVGDILETSGQGGWDPETGEFLKDTFDQIDQAFANADLALRAAGGKGLSQVFRVRSFHITFDGEALKAMTRNFHKWFPNHKPVWTACEIPSLALPEMKFEVEVSAHDPEGARTARGQQ